MPSTRQYRYLHKGGNEWLANDANVLEEGWQDDWEELKKETPHPIEFTEYMYANDEYFELPEWVNVTITDEHILELKLARGILKSLPTASSINFGYSGADIEISKDFGGIGRIELGVTASGAYIIIHEKHSSGSMELYISQQFNQAIGK